MQANEKPAHFTGVVVLLDWHCHTGTCSAVGRWSVMTEVVKWQRAYTPSLNLQPVDMWRVLTLRWPFGCGQSKTVMLCRKSHVIG